ncbi:uncharacterized protein LOC100833640 isoform X2 [Brachypodium distachyon]|uniref:Uncharacterized protein n=1 Tax=Brachypodium distachyon TaxID=15368 RepID=A0A0Q3JK49_BRADI|nr:uncharacterized protein LOC100833640 isoform X2 [Brachypodium distachyon]XP_014753294.1 uncharacterized protein LOC100833640 isoform X2 [Brachypodium distachyon]XP_024313240.1 uncharacterized protein LOC100833640 isoform X2 [Brachypodium distachyon]KQK17971.1 hypothetical protein BRADI_1g37830v3 [Brachypodium distachyon]|eukprot:XP_010227600.1 uncharacterized protein LOC100833640 isoform X2 [Brachypodium distachyon]
MCPFSSSSSLLGEIFHVRVPARPDREIMAEMVASAVVGETVGRISTFLVGQPDQKSRRRDDTERLEMAHIKIEAALHISSRWQITDVPMLRWRSKLKRAAQECDDKLRRRKQRALEDEEFKRSSSFPRRVAQAAKSLVSSPFTSRSKGVDESCSAEEIKRFERFAEGTSQFLKFVELGGTPRRPHTFFNPLIGDLLAGKALHYQALQGGRFFCYIGIWPTSFEERGVEAMVGFAYQDFKEPAKGLNVRLVLRLSESSDVFGIIIKCMQSAATLPHFTVTAEGVRRELIQLPTQDFSRSTSFSRGVKEYWQSVHTTSTHWLRPDPLCCAEHENDLVVISSKTSNTNALSSSSRPERLASTFPEQVIAVYLQCHVSDLSEQHRSREDSGAGHGTRSSASSGLAPLKLGVLFIPHDTPEGIEPAAESYAFEVIDGEEQEMVHTDASLQDVDEKLLPKAIDHLCQNYESQMYQMCLRSRHGTAHLCVEKTKAEVRTAGRNRTARSQSKVRNRRVDKKREENNIAGWLDVSRDLLKYWVVRASDKLHGSMRSWIVNSPLQN